MPIELINVMLARSEGLNRASADAWHAGEAANQAFLTEQKQKKDREAWVLRHFAKAYNSGAKPALTYAREREPPDFEVFGAGQKRICFVEVTEWIEPWRRRDKEYSGSPSRVELVPKRLPDPVPAFRELLIRKFEKAGFPTNVVVDQ
jgi:hypothetical protein